MKYVNKEVGQLVEQMEAKKHLFHKKPESYRQLLFIIAACFPSDKMVIWNTISGDAKTPTKPKKTGAKLLPKKQGKAKTNQVDLNDCDSCPETIEVTPTSKAKKPIKGTGLHIEKRLSGIQIQVIESPQDILTAFNNNTIVIKAYAQANGLEIPEKVTKPETAAKKLFEQIQQHLSENQAESNKGGEDGTKEDGEDNDNNKTKEQ